MSAGLPPPMLRMADEVLPMRIGSYAVRSVIGTGSMGVVYLGHDPAIDRPVAIKTIQRRLLESAGNEFNVSARFRVEAQAAGRLGHRNIVSVYQFGEDADFAYIVMEYVPGHTLGEYLRRPQRFSTGEVLCLMSQLLEALHYAHENGVVHRDIKPANLMVTRDGRLKITDFGIARTESSQVTRVNSVVGSPGYMAPEQYIGGPLDRRVDVFSAGVLLYLLLAGSVPFSGADEAVMYQIVYGRHESLVQRTGDATLAAYDAVIDKALAKNADQRYATAIEFRQALLALAQEPVAELLPRERLLPLASAETPAAGVAARAGAAAGGSGSGAGLGSGSGGARTTPPSVPVPTGWDEAQLASLERELMLHVGPVGKVLVRRAARGRSDLAAVRQAVATSIVDFEIRQRFLAGSSGAGAAPTSPRAPQTQFPDTRPPTALDVSRLRQEDVDKAAAVMARALGPIAKVLAKQCAARSTTREQFVAHVMGQLAAGVDAKRLEADLWRALS